jgi:hypothetical protein
VKIAGVSKDPIRSKLQDFARYDRVKRALHVEYIEHLQRREEYERYVLNGGRTHV